MYVLAKQNHEMNHATREYFCDTTADMDNIPTSEFTMGSTCYIIQEGKEYIADSNKKWFLKKKESSSGGGGESGNTVSVSVFKKASNPFDMEENAYYIDFADIVETGITYENYTDTVLAILINTSYGYISACGLKASSTRLYFMEDFIKIESPEDDTATEYIIKYIPSSQAVTAAEAMNIITKKIYQYTIQAKQEGETLTLGIR